MLVPPHTMVNINRGPATGNDAGNEERQAGEAASTPQYPQYLHELPQADEERLERIFKKLDRDGNDRIDIHDLSAALKEFGLSHQYAEVSKKKRRSDVHQPTLNHTRRMIFGDWSSSGNA